MLTSLYTAVSGLDANGTSLSVIGDNIANMNTIGYKASDISFGDILSQSITGSGTSQIGRGVQVSSVSPSFTQGSFQTSANGLDMAIEGDGFFMVKSGGAQFYTRAGQFSLDKDGNVVNPAGLIMQGYLADAAGNVTGTTGDLQIANSQSQARASTVADVSLNLDATAAVPAAAFTLGVPANTPANFNSSTTVSVYDTQGGTHPVTAYFVKTGANAWAVHYVQQNPANPSLLIDGGTQTLAFDVNGQLTAAAAGAAPSFNFGLGAQTVTFDYGFGTNSATSQYASGFSVIKQSQDGYASGSLKSVTVSDAGVLTGVFTNGQTRAIGQVALSRFSAPTKLTKMGGNLYAESFDSGQPIVGAAGTSGLGRVLSNSLELSNVDLATEFVKMITAQRGFEANSKVITTTDQMLQLLVNLKQ
jgi:flagellar hook protein FlgE